MMILVAARIKIIAILTANQKMMKTKIPTLIVDVDAGVKVNLFKFKYYLFRMTQQNNKDKKFSKFHGIDRDKIDWHPIVDEAKCIGCGMCATSCGRGVYKFDYKNKKSKVVNPNNCMVACITCANLCPVGAISFVKAVETPRGKAQKIVRENKILLNVREELKNKKEELSF